MNPPPVAIGHNNPPPDAMLVREDILARARICAEAADVWAGRETLDAETAPRARDFIAGAKKLAKEAE
ncbi:MAG: hypothetical protein NW203_03670, partial [Hyphomonadaceae bacterium]|nr:hypothetical protein [Hyphomonadaceae bacterium]